MVEEKGKPPAWGVDPEDMSESEDDVQELEAQRMIALDSATLAIPYYLEQIYIELKRYNDFMMSGVVDEDVKKMVKPKPTENPFNLEEPVPEKPAFAIPDNLESEKDIEAFYKAELATVLDEEQLSKTTVIVEEEQIILKVGYLPTNTWRSLVSFVEDIGGEYVSDGGKTHYVLPYPS